MLHSKVPLHQQNEGKRLFEPTIPVIVDYSYWY